MVVRLVAELRWTEMRLPDALRWLWRRREELRWGSVKVARACVRASEVCLADVLEPGEDLECYRHALHHRG